MKANKAFWKSKTFWINTLIIIGLIAAAPEIQALIGLDVAAGLIAFANILLRALTEQPIGLSEVAEYDSRTD